MNRVNKKVKLGDGNDVLVTSTKFLIIVSLSDSIETLFTFDSKDVEGLRYLHNNPVEYLVEQFSADSNIDEVLDSCESIKDNLEQLYRENPDSINYSKNYLQEDSLGGRKKMGGQNLQDKNNSGATEIFVGILILISFIILIGPLESFADMSWESGWLNVLKLPFTFLFGIAPVVLILWLFGGIALIIDGFKRNQKK